MTTIKEILTENRESIIASIKFIFKVWKKEDVRLKMIEFLAYAEQFGDIEKLSASKRIKTDLKEMVCKMNFSKKIVEPKGKSAKEMRADWMDANNLEFDLRTKQYYKI